MAERELRSNGKAEKCSIGEAALLLCAIGVPNPYYQIEDPAGVVKKSLKAKERLYPSQADAFTYFRTGNLKAEGVVIYRNTSLSEESDPYSSMLDEKIFKEEQRKQKSKKSSQEDIPSKGQMELPLEF